MRRGAFLTTQQAHLLPPNTHTHTIRREMLDFWGHKRHEAKHGQAGWRNKGLTFGHCFVMLRQLSCSSFHSWQDDNRAGPCWGTGKDCKPGKTWVGGKNCEEENKNRARNVLWRRFELLDDGHFDTRHFTWLDQTTNSCRLSIIHSRADWLTLR